MDRDGSWTLRFNATESLLSESYVVLEHQTPSGSLRTIRGQARARQGNQAFTAQTAPGAHRYRAKVCRNTTSNCGSFGTEIALTFAPTPGVPTLTSSASSPSSAASLTLTGTSQTPRGETMEFWVRAPTETSFSRVSSPTVGTNGQASYPQTLPAKGTYRFYVKACRTLASPRCSNSSSEISVDAVYPTPELSFNPQVGIQVEGAYNPNASIALHQVVSPTNLPHIASQSGANTVFSTAAISPGSKIFQAKVCENGICTAFSRPLPVTIPVSIGATDSNGLAITGDTLASSWTLSWNSTIQGEQYFEVLEMDPNMVSTTIYRGHDSATGLLARPTDGPYTYRVRTCTFHACQNYSQPFTLYKLTHLQSPDGTVTLLKTPPALHEAQSYEVRWSRAESQNTELPFYWDFQVSRYNGYFRKRLPNQSRLEQFQDMVTLFPEEREGEAIPEGQTVTEARLTLINALDAWNAGNQSIQTSGAFTLTGLESGEHFVRVRFCTLHIDQTTVKTKEGTTEPYTYRNLFITQRCSSYAHQQLTVDIPLFDDPSFRVETNTNENYYSLDGQITLSWKQCRYTEIFWPPTLISERHQLQRLGRFGWEDVSLDTTVSEWVETTDLSFCSLPLLGTSYFLNPKARSHSITLNLEEPGVQQFRVLRPQSRYPGLPLAVQVVNRPSQVAGLHIAEKATYQDATFALVWDNTETPETTFYYEIQENAGTGFLSLNRQVSEPQQVIAKTQLAAGTHTFAYQVRLCVPLYDAASSQTERNCGDWSESVSTVISVDQTLPEATEPDVVTPPTPTIEIPLTFTPPDASNPATPAEDVYTLATAVSPAAHAPPLASVYNDRIGATAVAFRVSETGQGVITVPISLPEGVAGVTPEVSLVYAGNHQNGMVGVGFSLSAASSISRCRVNPWQDRTGKAIQWNEEDRFCLDGQRLLLETGDYGHPESTYVLASNRTIKITALDGTAGNPESFSVEAKDGSVTTYGGDAIKTITLPSDDDNTEDVTRTTSWFIETSKDSVGTKILYQYTTFPEAGASGKKGYALTAIQYAFSDNDDEDSANAKVVFNYIEQDHIRSGYTAGVLEENNLLLNAIDVWNKGNNGAITKLRQYTLQYNEPSLLERTPTDLRKRLTSITECYGTGSPCLDPTTFAWDSPEKLLIESGKVSERADFVKPVYNRLVHFVQDITSLDFNGDGLVDYAVVMGAREKTTEGGKVAYLPTQISRQIVHFMANNGNGGFEEVSTPSYNRQIAHDAMKITPVDYNMDGKQDLLVHFITKQSGNPRFMVDVYLAREDAYGRQVIHQNPRESTELFPDDFFHAPSSDTSSENSSVLVGGIIPLDINFDGKTDYIYGNKWFQGTTGGEQVFHASPNDLVFNIDCSDDNCQITEVECEEGEEGEEACEIELIINPKYACNAENLAHCTPAPTTHFSVQSVIGDVNGDGLPDVLVREMVGRVSDNDTLMVGLLKKSTNGSLYVHIQPAGSTYGISEHLAKNSIVCADINGDGLADCVREIERDLGRIYNNAKNLQFEKNTGNGFTAITLDVTPENRITAARNCENGMDISNLSLGDGNADGFVDLTYTLRCKPEHNMWSSSGKSVDYTFSNRARIGTATGFGPEMNELMAIDYRDRGGNTLRFQDITGDGKQELVVFESSKSEGLKNIKPARSVLHVFNAATNDVQNLIHDNENSLIPLTITNGHGAVTHVTYDRINRPERRDPVYRSTDHAGDNPFDGLANTLQGTANALIAPVMPLQGAFLVATRVQSSMPQAGNPDAIATISYQYEDAKVQPGVGFLGFKKLTSIDDQTGIKTTTTYRQDWPYIGKPVETVTTTDNGSLIKKSTKTYDLLETPQRCGNEENITSDNLATLGSRIATSGLLAAGSLNVVTTQAQEDIFDFDGPGSRLSRLETETTFDCFGNALTTRATNKNGNLQTQEEVSTRNTYFSETALPLLHGRLRQSTVTTYKRQVFPVHEEQASPTTIQELRKDLLETETTL